MNRIKALSVLDGRYARLTEELQDIFSEYALIKYRVFVEIQWLKFLAGELGLVEVKDSDMPKIDAIAKDFNAESALMVKEIEKTTNHDVKAVEYYIKRKLADAGLASIGEWVHFACTS
ncbi:MAG: adenylosuccinate lyase, partial [Deltaproteobacteria bacterium]|nr:adenylosuccinate lyase [Deltaproteobacteria bacterium]